MTTDPAEKLRKLRCLASAVRGGAIAILEERLIAACEATSLDELLGHIEQAFAWAPDFLNELHELVGEATRVVRPGPGVCRSCGCTNERACPGGCSWAEEDPHGPKSICTSCFYGEMGGFEDIIEAPAKKRAPKKRSKRT